MAFRDPDNVEIRSLCRLVVCLHLRCLSSAVWAAFQECSFVPQRRSFFLFVTFVCLLFLSMSSARRSTLAAAVWGELRGPECVGPWVLCSALCIFVHSSWGWEWLKPGASVQGRHITLAVNVLGDITTAIAGFSGLVVVVVVGCQWLASASRWYS